MAVKFNGLDMPSFVKVNKITNSVLPEISQNTVKVPGRAGMYDFGNEIGNREIELEYTIVADDEVDLRAKVREFATWLYYDEAKPFIINEEPDKTYYAKVQGTTELNETLHIGQGTVKFICYDPYAYGEEKTVNLVGTEGDVFTVTNDGDVEAYPKLRFEFTQPTTEFTVLAGDRYMYFGQPADVGTVTPAPQRTLILHDDCSSLAAWTTGSYIDGGVVAGTMISDGNLFRPSDYGSGSAWHGPARVRMFDGGVTLTDFTVQCEIALKAGYVYQIGRVEIYLLDSGGVPIGKMALRDSTASANNPYMEARAGGVGGRQWVNYTGRVGRWANFGGAIRITRKGKKWEFSASKRASNGRLYDSFTYSFYDKDNTYSSAQLAGLQVHIGTYGSYNPVSTIYVEDIIVYRENTVNPVTEVPNVFGAGDVLDIDCATGVILKNEEPFYAALDPTSNYVRLNKGTTDITVSPQGIFDVGTLTFKERWR